MCRSEGSWLLWVGLGWLCSTCVSSSWASGPAWACSSQGSGKGTKPRQILANLPEAETQNGGIHLLFVPWTHQICAPLRTLALLSAWKVLSADPHVPPVSTQELLGWAFPTTQPRAASSPRSLFLIVPHSSFLKQYLVSVWKCLCVYLMSPLSLPPPQYVRSVGGGFLSYSPLYPQPLEQSLALRGGMQRDTFFLVSELGKVPQVISV